MHNNSECRPLCFRKSRRNVARNFLFKFIAARRDFEINKEVMNPLSRVFSGSSWIRSHCRIFFSHGTVLPVFDTNVLSVMSETLGAMSVRLRQWLGSDRSINFRYVGLRCCLINIPRWILGAGHAIARRHDCITTPSSVSITAAGYQHQSSQ